MNKAIVTSKDGIVRTIVMDENLRPEQLILSKHSDITLGSVYVGRVADVKKNLKACFVNITPDIKGFLAFEEFTHAGLEIPHEGDIIVVRVLKEPVKTKGYSLSIDIEISGEYCVISDHGNGIHYSKQLDSGEKENIKAAFKERGIAGDTKTVPGSKLPGSVIIRTNASLSVIDEVISEIEKIGATVSDIVKYGNSRTLYSCLYREKPSYLKTLTDLRSDSFDEIITDDEKIFEEIAGVFPDKARLYNNENISLNALYNVERAVKNATDKTVYLPCGGYIIIERTEAMTVIDVNSGKYGVLRDHAEMVRKVNIEAAKEIAYQLRYRNISGMILIDFINPELKKDEEELLTLLKNLFKDDKCKTNVYGFTNLKLVEISRQKIRASVYDFDM